jgi:selenide,water dikinase
METFDDAGVYKIAKNKALIQTVDFFFPIVNDPRDYGKVVAANSLSDVWAMGAEPLTAMNVLAYPAGKIPVEVIEELLIGGSEKLKEAGVVLVGGHTQEQDTFIYGMSVTGIGKIDTLKTNSNARVGDRIILTKPLGTGVMSSAVSADGLSDEQYKNFVETMYRLNKYASETLQKFDISALTDVTGFGLLGHSLPIARNADVKICYDVEKIPFFPDLFELMEKYNPKGVCKTTEYIEPYTFIPKDVDERKVSILSEAQTSGGLLACIKAEQAEKAVKALHRAGDTVSTIIGEVCKRKSKRDYYLYIK